MDKKMARCHYRYRMKLFVWQKRPKLYLLRVAIGCCAITTLSFYFILTTPIRWPSIHEYSVPRFRNRIQMSNFWAITDDNFFTNKEYDELMASHLRNQSFELAKPNSTVLDERMHEISEWKDDYLQTDDKYSEFDSNERRRVCQIPSKNVLFLKTHYTGSDVITNILNRFADLRNLLVAIPTNGLSSFYWPSRFHWRYMDMRRLAGDLPNVLCNHARYNNDVMTKFMPMNTHFLSILRDPVDHFHAVFSELDIARRLEIDSKKPFETFARDTGKFLKNAIENKRFFDSMNLLKNGMSFDLGLHTSDYGNEIAISSSIFDLQKKFTLVLIYEYLDESLVLLKRRLCWQIDDVIYLRSLLLTDKTASGSIISQKAKKAIEEWNMADVMLYDFFNATLWEQIDKEDNFFIELELFKKRRNQIDSICGNKNLQEGNDTTFRFANFTDSFLDSSLAPRANAKEICSKMAMTDVDYLEYFRDEQ